MKNTFKVIPFIGIEYISLGMSRNEIGETLLTHFSCPANYQSPNPKYSMPATDFFHEIGVTTYYDDNDLCDGICLSRPADPIFQRKHLLGNNRSLKKWKEWLNSIDGQPDVLGKYWTALASYTYGLEFVGQQVAARPENKPPYVVKLFHKGYLESVYKKLREMNT
jgi:hypothetical protein